MYFEYKKKQRTNFLVGFEFIFTHSVQWFYRLTCLNVDISVFLFVFWIHSHFCLGGHRGQLIDLLDNKYKNTYIFIHITKSNWNSSMNFFYCLVFRFFISLSLINLSLYKISIINKFTNSNCLTLTGNNYHLDIGLKEQT